MKQKLDLSTWNRKEHFEFFSQMEEPFYGLTTRIDCTQAYEKAKELNLSFFTYYLYQTLRAVNAVESFKYRIVDKEVYLYDRIDVSATIMRADKTFGFSFMPFDENLSVFAQGVEQEILRIQETPGLFTREFPDPNLIHFSALPWVDFTALSHARSFTFPDSCPKVSFGKLAEIDGKKTMAMAIYVHHGLVDGYHVSLFLEAFEQFMNS